MPASLSAPHWRRIAVAAYTPTLAASMGFGAAIPLITLVAHDLGASVALAAFMSALLGIGQLVADLPAGVLADRIGEKWAMVTACLVEAVSLTTMFLFRNLVVLGVAVCATGAASAVVALARQAYLTEALPYRYRARGMSALGGMLRIGNTIGPVIGAAVVSAAGMSWAFLFAGLMSLVAAIVTLSLPDLPSDKAERPTHEHGPTVWGVLQSHLATYTTVGVGAMLIMMVRAARVAIIPLWCAANGINPATTSLIYAVSMAFDVLLFLPGGWLMDHFGRRGVAIPTTFGMGICFALLPFTHSPLMIGLVAAGFGASNGISSGVVMTLGSDASPAIGRKKFLAGFRLLSDSGAGLGPLVITVVTVWFPLAAASVALAGVSWFGAGWLHRWVPRRPPGQPATPSQQG